MHLVLVRFAGTDQSGVGWDDESRGLGHGCEVDDISMALESPRFGKLSLPLPPHEKDNEADRPSE